MYECNECLGVNALELREGKGSRRESCHGLMQSWSRLFPFPFRLLRHCACRYRRWVFLLRRQLCEFAVHQECGEQRKTPLALLLRLGHAKEHELEHAHSWWRYCERDLIAVVFSHDNRPNVELHAFGVEDLIGDEHGFDRLYGELALAAPARDDRSLLVVNLHLEVVESLRRAPWKLIQWKRFDVFACPVAFDEKGDHGVEAARVGRAFQHFALRLCVDLNRH